MTTELTSTYKGVPIRKALWKYMEYGPVARYQMPELHNYIQHCYKYNHDFIELYKHVQESHKEYEDSISPTTQYYSMTDANGVLINV